MSLELSIRLEPFSKADFDRLIEWSPTSEFLLQWAGPLFTFPLNHIQMQKYLAACSQDPPQAKAFRAVHVESGQVIGHVEIGHIDSRNRSGRLGRVLIGPEDFRGKGAGRQLVRAALRVAFDELHLHRVDLYVFDFNQTAIHCYERAGFKHEGILRESRKHNGEYWNVCIMSILEQEWRP